MSATIRLQPSDVPGRKARVRGSALPDRARPTIAVIAHIGTLNEGSLHAALKKELAEPGDRFEVPLEGFVIDLVRGDLLIEIQTASFASMGHKLDRLLPEHPVRIVHPIAVETMLHKPGAKPRRSPKRGDVYALFDELVSVPTLLDHPHLSIEVVLVAVDVHQVEDPSLRRNRGGWRTTDRRLRAVVERRRFADVGDLAGLVPDGLPPVFTTADLATATAIPRDRAQKMAYCLRDLEVFTVVRRSRRGYEYRLNQR